MDAEHKYGRDEAAALNNHGTYYDVQTASFALFLRKRKLATEIIEASKQKRIARQIEPDGRQPLELSRTRAWSYSTGNLDGLTSLAILGENVGVDLWNFETPDGRSIRHALEYLYPFAVDDRKWPHQQISEFNSQSFFTLMRRASIRYRDENFQRMMARVPQADPATREWLLDGKKSSPLAAFARDPNRRDRTDWSKSVVDSTIKRFPTAESLKGWGYAKSLYLYGQYLVYLRTRENKYLDHIQTSIDLHIDKNG